MLQKIAQELSQPDPVRWQAVTWRIVWLSLALVGGPCVLLGWMYALSQSSTPISQLELGEMAWRWLLLPLTLLLMWSLRWLMWSRLNDSESTAPERLFSGAFLGGVLVSLPLLLAALNWRTGWLAVVLLVMAGWGYSWLRPVSERAAALAGDVHADKAN